MADIPTEHLTDWTQSELLTIRLFMLPEDFKNDGKIVILNCVLFFFFF